MNVTSVSEFCCRQLLFEIIFIIAVIFFHLSMTNTMVAFTLLITGCKADKVISHHGRPVRLHCMYKDEVGLAINYNFVILSVGIGKIA